MIVAVGSDHRGLSLKKEVIRYITEKGYEALDCGAFDTSSVDYPDIAIAAGNEITSGKAAYGILIWGTGIGMSIAANKVKGIRAALCCDTFMAERARLHNDANILCLGAEKTTNIYNILDSFFFTAFEGGRHQKRLDKITEIENNQAVF
jgi:ribose 5-phosphate isomerase B